MTADPRARTPVSVCIISYQEADRIEDCIRSVAGVADEVLVVDSGSTDGTVEHAQAAGADVRTNAPFPGHREQKQLAVDLARHDWVLCLDADERLSPELSARVCALRDAGLTGAAYSMPRRNQYLGRTIKRGLFWPDRKVRLFDRRVCRWGGTNPHDRVEVPEGAAVAALNEPIEHLSFRDFAHHQRTLDSFTRIAAEAMLAQGRRFHWFDLLFRPPAVFVKSLVLKRGFVDGWRGFLIAAMAFRYDWLKYWRLRQLWRQKGVP